MRVNNKGFSLVQVMVAGALISGLGVAVMSIFKNINSGQRLVDNISEAKSLTTEIMMILSNPSYCKASLNTGVGFKKSFLAEDGMNVSLWLADQDGNRSLKKFNGENFQVTGEEDKSSYGKLKISSMKLFFTNPQPGGNYKESLGHSDVAQLRVKYKTSNGSGSSSEKFLPDIPVVVGMKTNAGATTLIDTCSRESNILAPRTLTCTANVLSSCSNINNNELGIFQKKLFICDGTLSMWKSIVPKQACYESGFEPTRAGRFVLGSEPQATINLTYMCKEDMVERYGATAEVYSQEYFVGATDRVDRAYYDSGAWVVRYNMQKAFFPVPIFKKIKCCANYYEGPICP